ncbi:hypothetical protein ACJX0J_013290, partial [Zea mays]
LPCKLEINLVTANNVTFLSPAADLFASLLRFALHTLFSCWQFALSDGHHNYNLDCINKQVDIDQYGLCCTKSILHLGVQDNTATLDDVLASAQVDSCNTDGASIIDTTF